MLRRFALPLALSLVLAAPALAQSVRLIGEFRDWTAYAATEGTANICFALSKPQEVTPTPDGFTEAYLYMTHRPAEAIDHELNLVAGFTFAPDAPATISVSGQSFDLFTDKDAAWLLDPSQGDNLAGVIRGGTSAIVEGTSDKGIKITETFSLSGATAASRAITGDC